MRKCHLVMKSDPGGLSGMQTHWWTWRKKKKLVGKVPPPPKKISEDGLGWRNQFYLLRFFSLDLCLLLGLGDLGK